MLDSTIAFSKGQGKIGTPIFSGASFERRASGAERSKREAKSGPVSSLGTTTKSCNPPPSVEEAASFRRLEKWALQAAAREVLQDKRLKLCSSAPIPQRESVDIWRTQAERFHYGGLMVCGSVWTCPICAPKISERRREDLAVAFEKNRASGGSEQLWTFTAPHHLGQSLEFLLNAMNDARRRMLNRKPWKRVMSALGLKGTVRAAEVTHSFENGWHVHFHVLAFLSHTFTRESLPSIEEALFSQWRSACVAAGLGEPSRAHGVSVEDGQKAAAYVTKWGLEHEMTKAHTKQGREGHYTPFDFLRLFVAGDTRYGDLFKEYAATFKGKRQLVWSDGLRELLGMDEEKSDEVLAEEQDERATLFAKIPLQVWRLVLAKKKRGEVLEVCKHGQDALFDYLINVCESANYFGNG